MSITTQKTQRTEPVVCGAAADFDHEMERQMDRDAFGPPPEEKEAYWAAVDEMLKISEQEIRDGKTFTLEEVMKDYEWLSSK